MITIKKPGAPTVDTIGQVGQHYINLVNGDEYECVKIDDKRVYEKDSMNANSFFSQKVLAGADGHYIWNLVKAGGSGGASSYNDLKDRPFYEETEVVNEPLNITWDGNTDSLLEVALPTPEATALGVRNVYKMSDVVLSDEHLKSASIRVPRALNLGDVWDTLLGQGYIVSAQSATIVTVPRDQVVIVAVREDNYTYDANMTLDKGLYFSKYNTQQYISSFITAEPVEQTRTTLKKLDKKFLPDDIGGGAKIVEKTFTVPAQSKMTRTAQSNGMEFCFNYLELHEKDYSYQYRLIEGETYTFKAPDGNDYSVVASRMRGDGAVGFGIFTDTFNCSFEDIGDVVTPIVSVGDGLTVQVDRGVYNAFEYGISGKFEVTRCVLNRTIDFSVGFNSLEIWNYINGVHVQQETLLGFLCLCDDYYALKYTIRHFNGVTFKAELAYPLCVFKTFGDNDNVTEVKMDYVVWYDYAKKFIYKTANFLTGEIRESDFGNA